MGTVESSWNKSTEDEECDFTFAVIGKTGSGKSSLVREILVNGRYNKKRDSQKAELQPDVLSGLMAGTKNTTHYIIKVDSSKKIKVIDTRGMLDVVTGEYDSKTIAEVEKICSKEINGAILVCIEMHRRIDESTLGVIAALHKHHKTQIWERVVIALTKADEYPRQWIPARLDHDLLYPKVEAKFNRELGEAKDYLRILFTEESEFPIGLPEKEFYQIPILPTSQCSHRAMQKMKNCGHRNWLENLVAQICNKSDLFQLSTKRQEQTRVLGTSDGASDYDEPLVINGQPNETAADYSYSDEDGDTPSTDPCPKDTQKPAGLRLKEKVFLYAFSDIPKPPPLFGTKETTENP